MLAVEDPWNGGDSCEKRLCVCRRGTPQAPWGESGHRGHSCDCGLNRRAGGIRLMTVASESPARYAAWFHELDAWTEYWDLYHPETRGRYYFGDGEVEAGLLTPLLPRTSYPP